MEYLWTERNGVISVQVVNEMYARLTRSSLDRRDWAAFRRDCERLPQWRVQPLDRDVIVRAWAIQDRYQLSWWDALIVSAAKEGGCRYLLTEDLQAGQDFDGLLVVDPFTTAPSDLA
jgi:predicted nucleic acid-binding protein